MHLKLREKCIIENSVKSIEFRFCYNNVTDSYWTMIVNVKKYLTTWHITCNDMTIISCFPQNISYYVLYKVALRVSAISLGKFCYKSRTAFAEAFVRRLASRDVLRWNHWNSECSLILPCFIIFDFLHKSKRFH